MMPKMDGYHLSVKIHSLPNPPKVVIVTARNYESDRQALRVAGVSAFLPKPFSNRELLDVVANLLARK
jgi:CheY-like chemotaxis protein